MHPREPYRAYCQERAPAAHREESSMSARTLGLAAALLCLPTLCAAQSANQSAELKIPSFDHLRAKATDSVDITLGAWPLRVVGFFMDENDPEEAELKTLFRGLSSIRVRK